MSRAGLDDVRCQEHANARPDAAKRAPTAPTELAPTSQQPRRTPSSSLIVVLPTRLPRSVFELIVVDDASRDATATVAARHADKVVRLTGRSLGAAYACNRGVEVSRGEIVAFVDADVVVRPDTLPRMLA